jgi:hypothetical protein
VWRTDVSQSHSSALLIRVWLGDVDDTLRARLLSSDGPGTTSAVEDMTVAIASTPEDVLTAVGDWLERFLAAAGG